MSLVRKLKKPIELAAIRRSPGDGPDKTMGKGTEGFGGHDEWSYGIMEESPCYQARVAQRDAASGPLIATNFERCSIFLPGAKSPGAVADAGALYHVQANC